MVNFENTKIAYKYFDAWNAQNEYELRKLFTEDVKLVDWNIQVQSIDRVVEANMNIWRDVPDIHATVLDISISTLGRAYCHLNITSDISKINISVIDVLSINDGKIYRVDAYHNDS